MSDPRTENTPTARFIDTHCHIQHQAFDNDRDDVLARALESLEGLIAVGDDAASSKAAAALAADPALAGRVFAAAGIHPHNAAKIDGGTLDVIGHLLTEPGVLALGEIGLDYHYDFSPRPAQREVFRSQLELAAATQTPVVIHCREAEAELAELVAPFTARLAGGVMHCFSGGGAFAKRCLDWGFYISFAGNVTYPKAGTLREAAAVTPLDRIVVETDSPYLAPQPVRGKRCEPAYALHTAEFLAQLKGVTLERLAEATTQNARKLFSIPDPPDKSA